MTAPQAPSGARSTAARLARLHLRTGARALARVELETMAGRGELDTAALADLAEVRWRTGDLSGGGEAAEAHLRLGGDEPIAHVVAVEALAAAGRPREARQRAEQFLAGRPTGEAALGALFAGRPRSSVWPEAAAPDGSGPLDGSSAGPDGSLAAPADERPMARLGPGSGATALAAGIEAAIARGDAAAAAARLALLLRSEPAMAALVPSLAGRALAISGDRGPTAAQLHLARSDAYRLLGREHKAAAALQRCRMALAGPVEAEARS